MTAPKPFPMNAWYAAAWDYEIKRALTPRRICDTPVVLYRRGDGGVAALEDACWHRLLPLSLGHLRGDEVVCGYHGLVFNPAGRCTFMPAQETINPSACVRAFPVVEKYRLIWVWMGDPALADPATVPDFHWNSDAPWVGEGGTYYGLKCDYRLVVDNLMDLTHETYVHAGSIGDEAITRNPFDVTHAGRKAVVERWMEGIEPPPFWARMLGRPGPVDRWQIIHFEAPGIVAGDVGVAPAGTGARTGDRSQGVNGFFLAAITPETETSCHYFWNFVRNFRTDDQSLTKTLNLAHVNDGNGVYDQDFAVLEAQQRAIDRNPRQPFYNLNIDAGALWARRLIDTMLAAEQGGPAGDPPRLAAE
ncbi:MULTISPECIES: aromatic ring-hydroxylating dioxygenase subunit alpha [Methylobacteriaceae]|uniref:aromatic ring-hydroxylating dioxygenase subunit alpha n=1 Tax=Methylobacteriaceae TaxID=119045 RepID=UPI00074FA3D7|nr:MULTISPECIES: aromatic ring-hydroxylating dioxygenase subunit alpha [Methylobacteriaceae]AMB47070.1 Rieske (2Fe-2S) protein [Methylobacterium sp. AMS5]TFZ56805.1 aromatic ring-hydroxylating dioxygenase subunit alpha [Methylorubrum sp. Q1]